MTTPLLIPINNEDDVFKIKETKYMSSSFHSKPNISKSLLIHLIEGKPIVDISDEEYIHWFQLDQEALKYIKGIIL